MLLGLALIGLREDLHGEGDRKETGHGRTVEADVKSIHCHVLMLQQKQHKAIQLIPLYNWFEIDWSTQSHLARGVDEFLRFRSAGDIRLLHFEEQSRH